MRSLVIVLSLLAAAVAGIFGWMLGSGVEDAAVPGTLEPAAAREIEARPAESASLLPVAESPREVAAAAPGSEDDPLFSAALRRYAETELRRGWSAVRKDELPDRELAAGIAEYEKLVLHGASGIGAQLARRRTLADEALEDAKTGGVFALLAKLGEGGGPLLEVVRNPKTFDLYFQRESPDRARSPTKNHPDADAEAGVTLLWPAGVFALRGLMKEKDPYPRDVTLAGAGIDATMLVLGEDLSTRGKLRNFMVRDCTVHTNGNYLFDLRNEPATMRFERVRFVGFDIGAGGSCLIASKALAIEARQCRFEGGYGRSPRSGQIFDVRSDALLALFEGCRFSLVNLRIGYWHPGATACFRGCTLTDLLDDAESDAKSKPGVLFDQCSIAKFAGTSQAVPSLDLDQLFPNWKQRIE